MNRIALIALALGALNGCVASRPTAHLRAPINAPMAMDGTVVMYATQRDGTCCTWEYKGSKLVKETCVPPQ